MENSKVNPASQKVWLKEKFQSQNNPAQGLEKATKFLPKRIRTFVSLGGRALLHLNPRTSVIVVSERFVTWGGITKIFFTLGEFQR